MRGWAELAGLESVFQRGFCYSALFVYLYVVLECLTYLAFVHKDDSIDVGRLRDNCFRRVFWFQLIIRAIRLGVLQDVYSCQLVRG